MISSIISLEKFLEEEKITEQNYKTKLRDLEINWYLNLLDNLETRIDNLDN